MSKLFKIVPVVLMVAISLVIGMELIDSPVLEVNCAFAETPSAPDPVAAAYGARPLSLGGAFVAVLDDTNAIFLNPAGLSTMKDWSLTSMSTKLLQKVDYKLAGATYKVGPGTLRVGYVGTSCDAGYKYSEFGTLESDSPISYNSTMVLVSYGVNMANVMRVGKGMGDLSVGGTVKMIAKDFSGIDDASASGMDFDLGVALKPSDSAVTYGAALKNVGGAINWLSGAKENLEKSAKLGASAKLIGKEGLYKGLPGELLGNVDMDFLSDGKPMVIHVGLEYAPIQYLAIRVGLDQDPLSKSEVSNSLTAGVGLAFAGFRFDYAYRANSDAAELSNHYFSLSFKPEELMAKEVKKDDKKIDAEKKEVKEVKKEDKKVAEEKKETKNTSSDNIYELPEEYQHLGLQ